MEEMIKENALGQPEPEEQAFSQEAEATIPKAAEDNAFVEVKFNKETKKLTLDEAATLAQKGMKLDLISEELGILQAISRSKGIGFKEFVKTLQSENKQNRIEALKTKYTSDSELCDLLCEIENSKKPSEIDEVKAIFPEMTEEELPQEVKTAAKENGRGLLFEYLLYEHRQKVAAENEAKRQDMTRQVSLGSISAGGANHTADAEFLRGVWGK